MKILKLTADNIKRLTAVEITPDGNVVTIAGKNGAGKSSVLDSIAYALGGSALVPAQPIHGDEPEAKIVVDLGDLVVTRTFKREKVRRSVDDGSRDGVMEFWGPIKTALFVRNKEGASYPSPQAVLDKLIGRLSFDPLAFAALTPKQQAETLRQLINLDLTGIQGKRDAAAGRRAELKKQLVTAESKLTVLPKHADTPEVEVPMSSISQDMLLAEELRKTAQDAERAAARAGDRLHGAVTAVKSTESLIKTLTDQLEQRKSELDGQVKLMTDARKNAEAAKEAADAALAVVPDTGAIRQKLAEVEATNTRVRDNKVYAAAAVERDRIKTAVQAEDVAVKAAEDEKEAALAAVKFPVPGLGFGDDGITFNGFPFEQASTADQLKTSVAIGLALNPTLKVLLVRNGNALDSASLKLVAEQATAADAQIWMERVAETKDGVTVMIEDGAVI